MANRTLRRPYSTVGQGDTAIRDADSSEHGSQSERSGGIENVDTVVNGDGANNVRESDSASSIGYVEIDPATLSEFVTSGGNGSDNSDNGSEPRKRRGRKPGSKNRTGAKKAAESIEPFLVMVHTLAATYLKTPELMLDNTEAKQLSDAYTNFCEYHDIPVLSDKRMSEIQLVSALFMVYGPRMVAVRNRWKEDAKAKRAKNVTPISQQSQVN